MVRRTLNTDKAIRTNTQGPKSILTLQKNEIVEIGVYEGASSCFGQIFTLITKNRL